MRPPLLLIHLGSAPVLFAALAFASSKQPAIELKDQMVQVWLAHDHKPVDAARLEGVSPEVLEVSHSESLSHDSEHPTCPCRHRSLLEFLIEELGPPRWVRITFATLFVIYWIPFIVDRWLDKLALVVVRFQRILEAENRRV